VVDTLRNPVPHARVVVALDLATPDPTGRVRHDHEDTSVKAGTVLAASLANAQGLARARITSRDHTYAPLVARSRVYQDDGLPAGPWKRPGASGARPTGPQATLVGSIAGKTYNAAETVEATTITGQVTIAANGVVFEDCLSVADGDD
jgi:hypothetical protein